MHRTPRTGLAAPIATGVLLLALLASPTVAVAAGDAADQALAEQGVIVAADLPATWSAGPRDTTGEDAGLEVAKKIPACKGYVTFETSNAATVGAKSQDYEKDTAQIHNAAYVYADTATADKAFRPIEPTKTVARCLTKVLDTRLEQELRTDKTVKRTKAVVKPVEQSASTPDVDTVGFGGGYAVQMKDGTVQERLVVLVATRIGRVISTYSLDADAASTDAGDALKYALGYNIDRLRAAQNLG